MINETIFLAGMIGLYPAKVQPVSTTDIILQYKQIRLNFNAVLSEILKDPSASWQSLKTRSAIIYVPEHAEIDELIPILQKDFSFVQFTTVLVRVSKLPMNCLIEIELLMGQKDDSPLKCF